MNRYVIYTNVCSNKQEELEVTVQQLSCDTVTFTETWDDLHNECCSGWLKTPGKGEAKKKMQWGGPVLLNQRADRSAYQATFHHLYQS